MNRKGSDLLVAALENERVERIFAVPGEENLDIIESLRNSAIELIITRHEQSAARRGQKMPDIQSAKKEVGWLGLEPRTNALKGRCSTIELPTLGKRTGTV